MMVTSNQLILAGVESIRDRHYAYLSCDRCYSKVLFDGDTANWICIKCRSNRPNVVRRYRMNFRITDNTRLANVTVFGHNLDKFFGCTADEFYENVESLSQLCPQLINENLVDSMIEDTFVGCSFLFGFKVPHATHQDSTWNVGNLPSPDMILPNQDANSFPGGLQNSEKMFSNTVAWQMLFACSGQRFTTVLAKLRQIVDDFGSSQSLNTAVNESLLFTSSGYETVPSLSHTSSVKRKRVGSIDCTEQSLILSCDQDAGSNIEPKELTERAPDHSSVQSLGHLPGSLAENSFTNTMTDKLILTNVPNAHFETIDANTQFNNGRPSQRGPVCVVSKGNYNSRFYSDVLAEKDATVPAKLNAVNRKKSNSVSNSHLHDEPGCLNQELDKKSPKVVFDESSVDEIEICRAAKVISQECRVFADNFSFKRCSASAVSQEIEKKRVSLNSPSTQLGICATTSAQHQYCTLDLVEAPYSEDLEAFLKDYEENERLTCEMLPVPASNSKRIVCHLESVSQDSLSDNKNDLDWEQPYSEDLEEFLKEHKSDDKPSQVQLKPLNSSSMIQQTSVKDSFTSGTIVLKPLEPACPHVSGLRSLTESGCSDELFSFWSDDFEQQVAHSSVSKSVEKPARRCSSQQLIAESPEKHSSILSHRSSACMSDHTKNLRRNSLQQSPGQSPAKHFSVTKMEEICSIASVNETKENVEPLCYASDIFDSSSSILSGHNRHCPQRIRKLTRKTTSNTVTPPVICTKKTPRLNSFLNYRTPVNTISSSSILRANACDSFSSKSLHKKAIENCMSRKSLIVLRPSSTKKAGNETFATPADHSFDLFQSPCFTCAGLSRRQSRLGTDFPSSMKFRFSSTPLSTVRVCGLNSDTQQSEQSPRVVDDFPQGLADIAANTRLLLAEPSSPDCIASTLVPVSPRACVLNSYRDRTSILACETAASRSASLMSAISPELFGNSLRRHSYELSSGQAVCSRTSADRKESPVACNLFNLSQNVHRASMRNNISGLPFNQSDDMFSNSRDLFLD